MPAHLTKGTGKWCLGGFKCIVQYIYTEILDGLFFLTFRVQKWPIMHARAADDLQMSGKIDDAKHFTKYTFSVSLAPKDEG